MPPIVKRRNLQKLTLDALVEERDRAAMEHEELKEYRRDISERIAAVEQEEERKRSNPNVPAQTIGAPSS